MQNCTLLTVMCCLFINVCFTLAIPSCSHIQYHNSFSKFWRKIFWILCYQIHRTTTWSNLTLRYCVVWLETWHRLDRERISFLREILLETTIVIDCMCTSVGRDRLVVILHFTRGEKIVHVHMCCRYSQSFLAQWISAQKTFFWQYK